MKQISSTLLNYKLEYEELPKMKQGRKPIKKPIKVSVSKNNRTGVGQFLGDKSKKVKTVFSSVVNKVKHPRKTASKTVKKPRNITTIAHNHVILGIGLLLVVVSITYSTSVIYIGVDSFASRIALLPQVIFALGTLILAFSKLVKKGV